MFYSPALMPTLLSVIFINKALTAEFWPVSVKEEISLSDSISPISGNMTTTDREEVPLPKYT
jgi:hypothetical protein